jgi:hypothetical protein
MNAFSSDQRQKLAALQGASKIKQYMFQISQPTSQTRFLIDAGQFSSCSTV